VHFVNNGSRGHRSEKKAASKEKAINEFKKPEDVEEYQVPSSVSRFLFPFSTFY